MYVHKKAKLCFLASPRTASRAVRNALTQPAIGFTQVGAHHDGPEQGHSLQGLTPFCAVRNHWDATVSWWYNTRMHRKMQKPSMEWIAGHYSKNRYYFRAGTMFWFREIPGIITLRYENLQEELNNVLTARGLPKVVLPQFGVSEDRQIEVQVFDPTLPLQVVQNPIPDRIEVKTEKRSRHYSTYYDAHTRHFVEWCFLKEIRELGYRFEENPLWLPKDRK